MRYPHEEFIARKMVELGKEKIVLDVGGGERFQKWLRPHQHLFANSQYKTFDYDDTLGADIVGDIHSMPISDESVDAIICSSVLEHVRDPLTAVREMHRVLRKGGKIFVYVPSIYPYHARKGHYPDYWRFFDDTLLMMFKDWESVELEKVGGYFKTLFFFLPMQHRLRFAIDPLAHLLDSLFNTRQRSTTSGYCLYAIK